MVSKKLVIGFCLWCIACTFSNAQDVGLSNDLVAKNTAGQIVKDTVADQNYREDQFYLGVTYNLLSGVPSDVNLRGLSGGIHFGFLRDMPINERRNVAVAVGAGLSYDIYGSTFFIGENAQDETVFTVLTNDEYVFDTNRFSTAVIEAPIELRWRSSTPTRYGFWRVYAGFRVGYAYWYKAKFVQPGNRVIQTDIPEFNRTRLAATLSFGYNKVNFYANYSMNPFFDNAITTNTGETVDFRTIKLGIIFYIL